MYLGIDFSGGASPWKTRCSRPTVWVATIEDSAEPRLIDLRPVQSLPGDGDPFTRLIILLRKGDCAAAGIDAPFAIPARHLPPGGHVELLTRVGKLPPEPDRPFASVRRSFNSRQSFHRWFNKSRIARPSELGASGASTHDQPSGMGREVGLPLRPPA